MTIVCLVQARSGTFANLLWIMQRQSLVQRIFWVCLAAKPGWIRKKFMQPFLLDWVEIGMRPEKMLDRGNLFFDTRKEPRKAG